MKPHELRTWPAAYQLMVTGAKTLEYRKDDREGGFQTGDSLRLREYDPQTEAYSGREMTVLVTDVQRGPDWGIPVGYAVMSVKSPVDIDALVKAARQALDLLTSPKVRELLDATCGCDPDVGFVCRGCATVTDIETTLADLGAKQGEPSC